MKWLEFNFEEKLTSQTPIIFASSFCKPKNDQVLAEQKKFSHSFFSPGSNIFKIRKIFLGRLSKNWQLFVLFFILKLPTPARCVGLLTQQLLKVLIYINTIFLSHFTA